MGISTIISSIIISVTLFIAIMIGLFFLTTWGAHIVSTENVGDTTNWHNEIKLQGKEMHVIYFNPQKAGSWSCEVWGRHDPNLPRGMMGGSVGFARRSGNGSWVVLQNCGFDYEYPAKQTLDCESADINYKISIYYPWPKSTYYPWPKSKYIYADTYIKEAIPKPIFSDLF